MTRIQNRNVKYPIFNKVFNVLPTQTRLNWLGSKKTDELSVSANTEPHRTLARNEENIWLGNYQLNLKSLLSLTSHQISKLINKYIKISRQN